MSKSHPTSYNDMFFWRTNKFQTQIATTIFVLRLFDHQRLFILVSALGFVFYFGLKRTSSWYKFVVTTVVHVAKRADSYSGMKESVIKTADECRSSRSKWLLDHWPSFSFSLSADWVTSARRTRAKCQKLGFVCVRKTSSNLTLNCPFDGKTTTVSNQTALLIAIALGFFHSKEMSWVQNIPQCFFSGIIPQCLQSRNMQRRSSARDGYLVTMTMGDINKLK